MFKEPQRKDRYYHLPIEVRHINDTKGWGVFALEDFPKNTVVEVSPVVLYHKDLHNAANELAAFDGQGISHCHVLQTYSFNWNREGLVALCLGYGGMYNHSFNPTLYAKQQLEPMPAFLFIAARDIKKGEELTHKYTHWSAGLPFIPEDEPEGGVHWGPTYPGNMGTFDDALNIKRGVLLVDTQVDNARAKHILREEEFKKLKNDGRPRMGDWVQLKEEE